jgi:long-chain acyl-CoA synthetase
LQAWRRSDSGGIVYGGQRLPYGALAGVSGDLAAWLARRGLAAGVRVAVLAGNEPAYVCMLYAIWEIGAVAVPIGIRSTEREVTTLIAHARVAAVLCDRPRAALARAAAAAVAVAAFVCDEEPPLRPRVLRRPAPGPSPRRSSRAATDVAVITYTSGTTGAPKAVMLTHANLLWAALACSAARGDGSQSVGACISPLSHVPVFVSHLLCRILLGSTAVLVRKFSTDAVLDVVERHGITDLPLIGGMVYDVLALRVIPARVRRSLQKVSVGGAATPMQAKQGLARIFPGTEIIEAYGQSESTDGLTMARGTHVFDRPGTVGCVNPHVILAVHRPDGTLAEHGEEGELVVAGPTVMRGYYRNRAATAATVRDGWLRTGDLGRREADGFFYVTGRVKDLIISGGENISPTEVEEVLRTHPAIEDVAVIGTPHPRWGEQVTAVLVRRRGAAVDRNAIAAFAGARLAGFKKPRRIEFVPRLPRNAANKVQTSVLREKYSRKVNGWKTGEL